MKLFTLLFALCFTLAVTAQTPSWIIYGAVPTGYQQTKCSALDDSLNVWIANFGGGLSKMNQSGSYVTYNTSNSLIPSNNTNWVTLDTAGNTWVATSSGAAKFDGTTWTTYNNGNGLPGNNITCITVDDYNNKWFGIKFNGLTKYDGTTFTTWKTSTTGFPNNNVNCVALDADDNVWVGTYGGLGKFDGTTWTTYTQGVAATDQVYSIVIQNDSTMWIGTGGGLFKFNGTTFTPYTIPLYPSAYVSSVAIDAAGSIWAGTTTGGIAVLDTASAWTYYDGTTPGIGNAVNNIMIDEYDNKWVSTNDNGFARYGVQLLVGTNEEFEQQNVSIYPNPCKNQLVVDTKNVDPENATVQICETSGRLMLMDKLTEPVQGIDVDFLTPGIYFISIKSDTYFTTKKFVKE